MSQGKSFSLVGLYRAVIVDNKDPRNLRRLKLQVTTTGAAVTDWVWPLELYSLNYELPKIGQGVWVGYIGGNPEYPVWLGVFAKQSETSKKVYVKGLPNSIDLTSEGITPYIKLIDQPNNTKELDLVDTLVAMARVLKDHEERITDLEADLTALHNTLATRTSTSHTHTSAG